MGALKEILLYHVVEETVTSGDLANGVVLTMFTTEVRTRKERMHSRTLRNNCANALETHVFCI